MSQDQESTRRTRLMDGINYLRRHALEAYQSGDGSQVLHCSALALRKCEAFGKAYPAQKLKMQEIHWAYVLGMFCIIDDWFLRLVESALKQTDCEGESSTDRELVVMIHNQLRQPHLACAPSEMDQIPQDWWSVRSRPDSKFFSEDRVALSFLVELVWYQAPTESTWTDLIATWLTECPPETVLHSELTALERRLRFQVGIFTGEAFCDVQEDCLSIDDDDIQRDLFLAWAAYFNCDWEKLNSIPANLKHRVSVDHLAYVPLFYLQNISLLRREDPDDHRVASSRLQIARSRQPAQLFQQFRKSYATSQFLTVANAGFPQNAKANERLACLRMAMLLSLEALRTWDIGGWMSSMKDRAQSRLELGALGDSNFAIPGIIDSLRGLAVPDRKDSPRFDRCLQYLDAISVDRRRSCVKTILQSPPVAWRQAHTILCELSDAIPEDQFVELAEWSLKVESTDLLKNHWVHTLMDVWNEILPIAPQREELAVRLASALRKVTASPRGWDNVHHTIVAAILSAPEKLAAELVDILISTKCADPHSNQYRFSIALSVIRKRPEVGEPLLPFLQADVKQRNDLYQQQLLRRHDLKAAGKPVDRDPQFRRMIIDKFRQWLDERRNLQGSSISMSATNFYGLSCLVSWPRSEPDLVASIIEAIDSETVLFSDKFDYLAFLSNLVRSGPVGQARKIASHAVRWLQQPIPGRELLPKGGGPLSNFQISIGGQEELRGHLLSILQQSAIRCPEVILQPLLDWLPLNVSSHIPKFVSHFLSVALGLIPEAGRKSGQDAAMLVGLADTAGLLAISSEADLVVIAFRYVVLEELVHEFAEPSLKDSAWGRTLFLQWSNRLEMLARHPSVQVRESVAEAVSKWANSELPHSDQMEQLRIQLRQDCRLRVRNAVQDEPRDA